MHQHLRKPEILNLSQIHHLSLTEHNLFKKNDVKPFIKKVFFITLKCTNVTQT